MILKYINSKDNLDIESEMYYEFHESFDVESYPQVHDFYEILIIIDGILEFEICKTRLKLKSGDMVFIRPGDIHSKILSNSKCNHINLAFPKTTIDSIFDYLQDFKAKECMLITPLIPVINMTQAYKNILISKIHKINLLPLSEKTSRRSNFRIILIELFIDKYLKIFNNISRYDQSECIPDWFNNMLEEMHNPDNLGKTLSDWSIYLQKSKEHICRQFRKYLNTTPTNFITSLRLNYAENLLIRTNLSIIDVAYESGFQNLSHFNHIFKKSNNLSPTKYRLLNYN